MRPRNAQHPPQPPRLEPAGRRQVGRLVGHSRVGHSLAVGLTLALATTGSVEAANRRAFVTSTKYNGDFASLPVAGSTALDKADSVCRQHAASASLPNSQTYRAWLSTPNDDAYCHVQGLTGKKVTGCNGAAQPGGGPWYQVNGATAFTDTLERLTGPERAILRNILWRENGQLLPFGEHAVWTGTTPTGEVAAGGSCSGWASTSGNGATGSTFTTAFTWTSDSAQSCDTLRSIVCLEPGAGTPFNPFWTAGSLVFVTKDAHPGGNLSTWPGAGGASGLAAGDAICRAEAAAAGLPAPSSFFAWLSTAQTDAADRLLSSGPYKRPDGFAIANSRADLLDGSTQVSIHVTAEGRYLERGNYALTGTLADGTWSGADCAGWTSAAAMQSALVGGPAWARTQAWTQLIGHPCSSSQLRLLCFSNVVAVFWDGFETGGTDRWSSTTP